MSGKVPARALEGHAVRIVTRIDPLAYKFLKETIDARVFSSLSTRAGGEVIGADQF